MDTPNDNQQYDSIIIPEGAGVRDLQILLSRVENRIRQLTPKLSQYKIDRTNARSSYDDAVSNAKINAIENYELKPAHQTLINAYANADADVKRLKEEWLLAKAKLIKADDYMKQLQGQRDTLKALVKSENPSYA